MGPTLTTRYTNKRSRVRKPPEQEGKPGPPRPPRSERCRSGATDHLAADEADDRPGAGPAGTAGTAGTAARLDDVILAYVDESGDDGAKPGASFTYSLGCVLVESRAWASTFDSLITFRRFVSASFGVPVRAEIKANFLLHNGGPLRARPLSERARFKLYRTHMRIQDKLDLRAFAVVIDKAAAVEKFEGKRVASDIAWEYLLQRLERTYRTTEVLLIHDEGDGITIRKRARKARRAGTAGSAFGTGLLTVPFRNLLDDPVSRVSGQSYFLQLADLNAYAAFRRLQPPPENRGRVVPARMWDFLRDAHLTVVRNTAQYGGPPAIVPGP